jgi:hypothetical protein
LQQCALGFQTDDALFQLKGFFHVQLMRFLLLIVPPRFFQLLLMFAKLRLTGGKLFALLFKPLAGLAEQRGEGEQLLACRAQLGQRGLTLAQRRQR